MHSKSLIFAMALLALLGLVGARSSSVHQRRLVPGFLPAPVSSSSLVHTPSSSFLKPVVRAKTVAVFQQPPGRPTRKNEPDEYFKSNLEKKPMSERLIDPQVIIALVGILLPFIAVGVLFSGGFLTR